MAPKAPPKSPHADSPDIRPDRAYQEQIRLDTEANDSDGIQDGDFNSNGLLTRTAEETYTSRQIVGTAGVGVTNGTGVAGNPTVALDINGLTAIADAEEPSDFMAIYDASEDNHKKILLSDVPGLSIQKRTTTTSADTSGTTVMVFDDTIPQITEGDELFQVSITPKDGSNILQVEVDVPVMSQGSGTFVIGAIFRDTNTDAIAAQVVTPISGPAVHSFRLLYREPALSATLTTFSFRYGGTAGTTYINSRAAGGILSTSTIASISVTEYTP